MFQRRVFSVLDSILSLHPDQKAILVGITRGFMKTPGFRPSQMHAYDTTQTQLTNQGEGRNFFPTSLSTIYSHPLFHDTLASRAWAGGTFFLLYVVSVFGSGGKKVLVQFWFKYVFTTNPVHIGKHKYIKNIKT